MRRACHHPGPGCLCSCTGSCCAAPCSSPGHQQQETEPPERPERRATGALLGEEGGYGWRWRVPSGIKRLRRLYCNVGIGFHIQVLPNGKVTGVHNENRYSLLELSPVERGVLTLFGVRSGLFIAMSDKGKLYGSGNFNDECKFKENLLANNYNAYESAAYPGMYIGLSKTGKTKRGNRVTPTMTMTHFLPRI
ncbi:hypothetical protein F7725_009594 [Dissostichus mawsoni]|uniref:Fibroblast growth factor n=1 Tax=Dissostichus mawsoni TaxID=36200 RepID=A0A7J5XL49_DISMA|nr:hypothetical protein F7725_009594 [Dissostichus mawsoni]